MNFDPRAKRFPRIPKLYYHTKTSSGAFNTETCSSEIKVYFQNRKYALLPTPPISNQHFDNHYSN